MLMGLLPLQTILDSRQHLKSKLLLCQVTIIQLYCQILVMHLDFCHAWKVFFGLTELVKEKSITSHHPSHNSIMHSCYLLKLYGTQILVLNCNGEEGIMVPYLWSVEPYSLMWGPHSQVRSYRCSWALKWTFSCLLVKEVKLASLAEMQLPGI